MNPRYQLLAVILALAGLLAFAGCSAIPPSTQIDKAGMASVKKIAVVVFTVPVSIEYRDDPKSEEKESTGVALTKLVAQAAFGINGQEAATVTHESFVKALNRYSLPFQVVRVSDMRGNPGFAGLYKPAPRKEKSGLLGSLGGLTGGGQPEGIGPSGMGQFGLCSCYLDRQARTGASGEKEYIRNAIKVLNVDAVLLVSDHGYSLSCKGCAGVGSLMAGAASTGSAFTAELIDRKNRVVFSMRDWFGVTGATAPMAAGAVAPAHHRRLFEGHGEKMARLFAQNYNNAVKGITKKE